MGSTASAGVFSSAHGRFDEVPSRSDLERFFVLDETDLSHVLKRRGGHNRLGFAVQLATVRYLGAFLADPLAVPPAVVEYLGRQLGMSDFTGLGRYVERPMTAYEHAWEIREAYGFRAFEDSAVRAEFDRFLMGRAWTHAEGPAALVDQAVGWLRRHRVLLPGVSVLTRLVASTRERTAGRLHEVLAKAAAVVDPALPGWLRGALSVPEGSRFTRLQEWQRSPTRVSGPVLVSALDRAADLEGLRVREVDCSAVPANRLAALARYGMASKAPTLHALAEPRRTATLVALVRHLDAVAVDDVLDLFVLLMTTKLLNPARKATSADRLAWLPRLEKASRVLASVNDELLTLLGAAARDGGSLDVAGVWARIEPIASRELIAGAVATVAELVPDDDANQEAAFRVALADRYRTVRPFVLLLCESSSLAASPAGRPVLAAVRSLPALVSRRVSIKPLLASEIDEEIVPAVWRRAVFDAVTGRVDRDAYVVCALEQLHKALRVRDVYATCSHRWADPRARLLAGPAWEAVRPEILNGLGLERPVHTHLAEMVSLLDATWKQASARLEEAGDDARVKIVPAADGRARLSVERLEALPVPDSLTRLRATTASMLPAVDLPELLLEVHAWTGFLNAYVHVSGADTRLSDLDVTIAALLIADGCNVGFTPVTNPAADPLTLGRLSHVDQNYVRAETHSAANRFLIDAQAQVPIAQLWGGGLVASVDGLRFVVPVRTMNAGPSPKYFGYKHGVTWLNAVNDQVAGIGAQIVPGTPRDSLHILDVLLNLDGGPKPELIATDEASYSDMVFGLFKLLGYRFSPRIADIGDTRYWRAEWPAGPVADYGPLNAIARHKINLAKITAHWPDMLRVVGSLVTHQVRAYDVLRMLARDGRPSPLGQAFTEYGRIAKTLHMLAMIDPIDDNHLRAVNRQTTVQESRHRLGRKMFHGKRGQLHQKYRDGQEDQLGALGLIVNAITLWNTRYLDAAVTELRVQGHTVDDADVARLSPLGHAHVNELGRYSFHPTADPTTLRAFRDPEQDT